MTRSALEELSSLYRISSGYHDIEGHYHATSDATRRALLAAMGVAAGNEAEVLDSLEHYRREQWQRVLPAAKVCREHQPVEVCITVPRDEQNKLLRWVVETEDGSFCSGEFSPENLDVVDESIIDGASAARFNLRIDKNFGAGYHWLGLENLPPTVSAQRMKLIITPARCYVPDDILSGGRFWGISLQLYSVRSERNWGMGDFGDLLTIIENMSTLGCSCIGLNPLHALYPHRSNHISPYSPSSRLFLNPLYIEIDGMEDFRESRPVREAVSQDTFQARLAALRHSPTVEYEAVAEMKYLTLRQLFLHFCQNHLHQNTSRGREFARYQQAQGQKLRKHALFESLCAKSAKTGSATDHDARQSWLSEFQSTENETTQRSDDLNDSAVEFYEYLQWQAETQLEHACQAATDCGLALSLYQDLAVGSHSHGADTWSNPTLYARSAHIGAPPDAFSPTGQDWQLAPYIPHRLEGLAYEPFIDLLRRNMQHAGVLRIDHVMGMHRLFWVPQEKDVAGAYVHYAMHDLQGILALESQRNRCLVIGEDLGTVSDELRSSMREREIFAYKVFYFEKNWHGDHGYLPSSAYPAHSLVTATTHDLPTVVGFWCETDLKLRDELGLFRDAEDRNNQYWERRQNRVRLIDALRQAGLWEGAEPDDGHMPPGLNEALHAFLARAPAALMMIQLEDMLQVAEQTNVPATTSQYPNWRRKLPSSVEAWPDDNRITSLANRVHAERSKDGRG